jgi:hypothetical protein
MAKVTALSPDLMTVSAAPATSPMPNRAVEKGVAPAMKPAPLQIRIPAAEVKAIKRSGSDNQ